MELFRKVPAVMGFLPLLRSTTSLTCGGGDADAALADVSESICVDAGEGEFSLSWLHAAAMQNNNIGTRVARASPPAPAQVQQPRKA